MDAKMILAVIAILLVTILPIAAVIYLIIEAVKDVIWYKEDCKFRYAQYQRAQKTLDDLEEDINRHKDYDWTKEPEEPVHTTANTRPGSDAHYAAWREEQLKKKESRE